jgi:hypothetical protein
MNGISVANMEDVAGKLSDDIVNGEKHCNGVPNSFSTICWKQTHKDVQNGHQTYRKIQVKYKAHGLSF